MKQLDDYFRLQKEIYDYFGYVEDWVVIPIDDARGLCWRIEGGEGHGGTVKYARTVEILNDEEAMQYWENEIYTQRFLPKWVYRGEEYTMICVDTRTDGNRLLQIFTNVLEVPPLDEMKG